MARAWQVQCWPHSGGGVGERGCHLTTQVPSGCPTARTDVPSWNGFMEIFKHMGKKGEDGEADALDPVSAR